MPPYSIEAQNLTKSFGKHTVLDGVNLSVSEGTVLALLGTNGAGKTTTVRILATLMKPDSGRAIIGGYDVVSQPQKVQSIIGVTGQSTSIDEKLSGLDNLIMFGQLRRLSTKDARTRAHQLIEQFELTEAAHTALKSYSGGMRRKLDLATSLIVTPPILFLDEPTTGLDPVSRNAMWSTIRQLVSSGTTVLLTTQYLDEADQLADAIAFIDDGRVVATGTPTQLKAQIGTTRFDITAATDEGFHKLSALLPKQVLAADFKARTVSFKADNTDLDGLRGLGAIITRITASHITIENYSIQQASLDDVFMSFASHTVTKIGKEN